jgi:hypothetical protein
MAGAVGPTVPDEPPTHPENQSSAAIATPQIRIRFVSVCRLRMYMARLSSFSRIGTRNLRKIARADHKAG